MNWLECEIKCNEITKEMYESFVKTGRWALIWQLSLACIVGIFLFTTSFAEHPYSKMFQCICFGTFIANILHQWVDFVWNKRDFRSKKRNIDRLKNMLSEKRFDDQDSLSRATSELTKRLNDTYHENTQQESTSQSAET